MHHHRSVLLLAVLALAAGCVTSPSNQLGPLQEQGSAWANYYKAGDIEGLMTLYVDDAIVALHGQPALYGVEQIRAYFEPTMGKADVEFVLDYELLERHRDTAHLMSKYWLTSVDRETGNVYKDAGRSVLIYKKGADGNWKIAVDIDQATPDVVWPAPEQ